LGGYPSGQRGLTVNQLAEAFGGSNPSPPTFVALIAQTVEHILGKNGVMGSNPIEGSCYWKIHCINRWKELGTDGKAKI
jgi:hypothetical protein